MGAGSSLRGPAYDAPHRSATDQADVFDDRGLTASQAREIGLVDEVSERPEEVLRRLWLKVARLRPSTLGRIKRYFSDVAGISEAHEARAMQETDRAMNDPEVRSAIENFVLHGTFPWEGNRPGSPRAR